MYDGKVVHLGQGKVKVHYIGWRTCKEELVKLDSGCIEGASGKCVGTKHCLVVLGLCGDGNTSCTSSVGSVIQALEFGRRNFSQVIQHSTQMDYCL